MHLDFQLGEVTSVKSTLRFESSAHAAAAPLELCGHTDVVLSSLTLNGTAVVGYERTAKGGLVIHAPAGGCVLVRGGRQFYMS